MGVLDLFGSSPLMDPAHNNFQAQQYNMGQQPGYAQAVQQQMAGMQGPGSVGGQQSSYADALRQQMAGNGPSLAQGQLQQGLQQNQAATASGIASQRGMNPGLAAKLMLDQQAQSGQQMAGQSALLRNQEQMQATGMLGAALGQQRGQDISQLGTMGGLNQGQNALNSQNYNEAQGLNAGVAGQNAGFQQAANSANAATSGSFWGGLAGGVGNVLTGGMWSGMGAKAAGIPGAGGGPSQIAGGQGFPGYTSVGNAAVPFFSSGGPVDSPSNDVVPAMLSPGEVVLPRSVTLAEDAPERAAEFVRAIRRKKEAQTGEGYGRVLAARRGRG